MRTYNSDNYKKIAILGSFSKHYDLIVDVSKKFIYNGFNMLVPKIEGVKDSNSSFLILIGDTSNDPRQLELDYLNKCLEADLVYVCNKDGYIGTTVAFELGVLTSYGQEIYFMEKPNDDLFFSMIHVPQDAICSPETLINRISLHNMIWNSRDWFDGDDKDTKIPFALIKRRNNDTWPKVIK